MFQRSKVGEKRLFVKVSENFGSRFCWGIRQRQRVGRSPSQYLVHGALFFAQCWRFTLRNAVTK